MCGAVCGAVGACPAGRIVACGKPTHSPREDYPRCSVGWCAMQAGPELGGMGGRHAITYNFRGTYSLDPRATGCGRSPPSTRCAQRMRR